MIHIQQLEYPRLKKMLECGCPFKQETKDTAICKIFEHTVALFDGEPEDHYDNASLLRYICLGMERYLRGYQTRTIFKQQLKLKLLAWINEIETLYHLPPNSVTKAWPCYIDTDIGIELVKKLHSREPKVTKHDLFEELGVSRRTIQYYLRQLDPKLNEGPVPSNVSPLRIGGQAIHVDIKWAEVKNRGDRAYYTPNTLHPLVLQLNVTQTAAILMALQNAYDRGDYDTYCEDVALDIWCQLSDYCKERIELIFAQYNQEFSAFLEQLKKQLENGRYPVFRTERIMAESGTLDEQLSYACKTGHLCNITLRIAGETVLLQKKRIFQNNTGTYYYASETAESAENPAILHTEKITKPLEFI